MKAVAASAASAAPRRALKVVARTALLARRVPKRRAATTAQTYSPVVMASNAGRLGSTRASVSVYIVPVVSLLLGALVRHEAVAVLAVVGCGIAISGAYLTNRARA